MERGRHLAGGLAFANLNTDHGDLDVSFHPASADGCDDLARNATPGYVGDVQVQVASLADVIRSKTTAGRPKDERALPELEDLLRQAQPGPSGSAVDGQAADVGPTVDRSGHDQGPMR